MAPMRSATRDERRRFSGGASEALRSSSGEMSALRTLRLMLALLSVAHGSTEPLDSNATAEGRAKNRRVEMVLGTGKDST